LRDTDNEVCGGDVVDQLLGGSPDQVPGHYAAGSPIRLLPLGVPQRLITGVDDPAVPPHNADAYATAAKEAGDDAKAVTLDGAAHFEPIVPGTDVWPDVQSTILRLFETREQEIWALEETYVSAFENAKHGNIVALLHRDFLGWPSESLLPTDKRGGTDYVQENFPESLELRFELKPMGIRVSGDVAIVHYLVTISEKDGCAAGKVQMVRITHTWIKEGSEWKILGGMSSNASGPGR
jgi:ketosteroid isomerase-like protein